MVVVVVIVEDVETEDLGRLENKRDLGDIMVGVEACLAAGELQRSRGVFGARQ